MLRFAILLVLVAAISYCDASCHEKHLAKDVCAVLFEKEDCNEGGAPDLHLKEGEEDLHHPHKDNAESVLVQEGCTFRGYDVKLEELSDHEHKAAEFIGDKKNFVVVTAPEHENKWVNFDKAVRKTIKSVSCRCGNQGQCPQVPHYLCAIAYEKVGCDHGEWNHPLEIPHTEELNLEDVAHFNYRSKIESVSVRKGCTFKGFKEANLHPKNGEGEVTIEAPKHEDLHFDLKDDKALRKGIESISCICH